MKKVQLINSRSYYRLEETINEFLATLPKDSTLISVTLSAGDRALDGDMQSLIGIISYELPEIEEEDEWTYQQSS